MERLARIVGVALNHARAAFLNTSATRLQYLQLGNGREIAFHQTPGKQQPGIVYMHGYGSTMNEKRAVALEEFCRKSNLPFVRFDYEGTGSSTGDFEKVEFGDFIKNATDVLDRLTSGPQLLIGHSMGIWITLHVSLARPERLHSLILLAGAINVTERLEAFKIVKCGKLLGKGTIGPDGKIYLSEVMHDSAHLSRLPLNEPLDISCPIRLHHGVKDRIIPWRSPLELPPAFKSNDVDVIISKNASHALSQPKDLQLLLATITQLVRA